jgi:hypothetical protein
MFRAITSFCKKSSAHASRITYQIGDIFSSINATFHDFDEVIAAQIEKTWVHLFRKQP